MRAASLCDAARMYWELRAPFTALSRSPGEPQAPFNQAPSAVQPQLQARFNHSPKRRSTQLQAQFTGRALGAVDKGAWGLVKSAAVQPTALGADQRYYQMHNAERQRRSALSILPWALGPGPSALSPK